MKTRKTAKALAVAVIALVAAAPAASAHVTVQPGTAVQGGYMKVDVRVPNERDDSGTTSVEFNLPEDVPIRSVRVEAVPGWEYEIENRTLDEPIEAGEGDPVTEVVSKITWSGGVIQPGEFQDFPVSLGPLPEDVEFMHASRDEMQSLKKALQPLTRKLAARLARKKDFEDRAMWCRSGANMSLPTTFKSAILAGSLLLVAPACDKGPTNDSQQPAEAATRCGCGNAVAKGVDRGVDARERAPADPTADHEDRQVGVRRQPRRGVERRRSEAGHQYRNYRYGQL